MKLHLGCGTVYLDGFVNIDTAPDYLTPHCPSLILTGNMTTLDKYYKHEFGEASGHVVADMKWDLGAGLPFKDGVAEQVVLYQVLEHFPAHQAESLVGEIARVLRPGSELRVSVPDLLETAKLLVDAKTPDQQDWAVRLIHGTQRNRWAHHMCGYLPRTLKALLEARGLKDVSALPSLNFYPAIHLRAMR